MQSIILAHMIGLHAVDLHHPHPTPMHHPDPPPHALPTPTTITLPFQPHPCPPQQHPPSAHPLAEVNAWYLLFLVGFIHILIELSHPHNGHTGDISSEINPKTQHSWLHSTKNTSKHCDHSREKSH